MIDCFDIYDRLLLCVQERLECVAARVGGTHSYVKGRIALEGQEKAKPIPGRVQINPVAVNIKSRGWVDVIREEIQYLLIPRRTNKSILPLILLRSSMSSSMSHLKLSSAAVIDQPNR